MTPPAVPLTLPKEPLSEENMKTLAMNPSPAQPQTGPPPDASMPPRQPYGSAPDPRAVNAELEKRGPSTERLLRPATPAEPAPPTTALALRPFEAPRALALAPQQLDPRLILMREPHSQRAVSFRLLRDGLLAKSMPRVVAVTSATPKEGKTTCAVNLALALAEQPGTRVLLLDANFADPELDGIFMVSRLPSIAPPAASSWLAPYKIVEARPTLHVGGILVAPGEPRPSFDQQRFDAMLDRLVRVAYDYIIVDTQALLGTPSVVQLISSVDSALLAVRSGGTTTRHLRQAVDQIPKAKALGIALVDA
jgi:Mrp family chromosome partitioning ATPase